MARYRRVVIYLLTIAAVSQLGYIIISNTTKYRLQQTRSSNIVGNAGGSKTRTRQLSVPVVPDTEQETIELAHAQKMPEPEGKPNDIKKQLPRQVTPSVKVVIGQFENASGPKIVSYKLGGGFRQTFAENVDLRKCKYNDCSFRFIPRGISTYEHGNVAIDADAVILQGNRISRKPLLRRDPNQVYVFFDMECPWYTHLHYYKHPPWKNAFNWTMTYRMDSDIPNPYAIPVLRSEPLPEKNYSEIFNSKTKSVLWFVSHCITNSSREWYVKELGKYIDVDIYGICTEQLKTCFHRDRDRCLPNVTKSYKFYLSFENTMCKDYITEKYYTFLNLDVVPIVRGASNYKGTIPKGTYISTADFDSPKDLAGYLKKVGESEAEYTQFLKEKARYAGVKRAYQRSFCSLCEKLHHLRENERVYEDIGTWWVQDACHPPRDLGELKPVLMKRKKYNHLQGWNNSDSSD